MHLQFMREIPFLAPRGNYIIPEGGLLAQKYAVYLTITLILDKLMHNYDNFSSVYYTILYYTLITSTTITGYF